MIILSDKVPSNIPLLKSHACCFHPSDCPEYLNMLKFFALANCLFRHQTPVARSHLEENMLLALSHLALLVWWALEVDVLVVCPSLH